MHLIYWLLLVLIPVSAIVVWWVTPKDEIHTPNKDYERIWPELFDRDREEK